MTEVWKVYKVVCNGNRIYEVSNLGRVKVNDELVKIKTNGEGYATCFGIKRIHIAVAQLFLSNPNNYNEIDHINTIKTDNRVCNLRWCTHKENSNNPLTKQRMKEKSANKGKPSTIKGKHRIYHDNGTWHMGY